MRKQDLIHLHGLLAEVANYCNCNREGSLSLDLTDYQELETRPTSIHLSKGDHQEAVFALAEAITQACRDERTGQAVASTQAETRTEAEAD